MKKLLLGAILLFSMLGFGQETEFKMVNGKLVTSIVQSHEGKTAKELYTLVRNYINVSYKNPEEVIKGSIDGEFIKLNGFTDNYGYYSFGWSGASTSIYYTISFYFKDNKLKMDVVSLESYIGTSAPTKYRTEIIGRESEWYKDDGITVRTIYKNNPVIIPQLLNDISHNVSEFIEKPKQSETGW